MYRAHLVETFCVRAAALVNEAEQTLDEEGMAAFLVFLSEGSEAHLKTLSGLDAEIAAARDLYHEAAATMRKATSERTPDEVEVGLGVVKLGNCTCEDPLDINGEKVWASQCGAYDRDNPGCENFKPYREGESQSCGTCKFWEPQEGIDAYE